MHVSEILPYVSPQAVHRVAFEAARGHELNAIDWSIIGLLAMTFGCAAFIALRRYMQDRARFSNVVRVRPVPLQVEPFVWVNTRTGVYFNEGHRWYKRTREGSVVRLSAAIASGCRASRA